MFCFALYEFIPLEPRLSLCSRNNLNMRIKMQCLSSTFWTTSTMQSPEVYSMLTC